MLHVPEVFRTEPGKEPHWDAAEAVHTAPDSPAPAPSSQPPRSQIVRSCILGSVLEDTLVARREEDTTAAGPGRLAAGESTAPNRAASTARSGCIRTVAAAAVGAGDSRTAAIPEAAAGSGWSIAAAGWRASWPRRRPRRRGFGQVSS